MFSVYTNQGGTKMQNNLHSVAGGIIRMCMMDMTK